MYVLSDIKILRIRALRAAGHSLRQIAAIVGCSKQAAQNYATNRTKAEACRLRERRKLVAVFGEMIALEDLAVLIGCPMSTLRFRVKTFGPSDPRFWRPRSVSRARTRPS